MPKTATLDDKIVTVLTKDCHSDRAAKVLALAETELAELGERADAADAASLNPLASAAKARELRQQASDQRFEADRMSASVDALRARVDHLRAEEERAVKEAAHAAALKVRDELAADIAREYPAIVRQLTAMVKRIIECDNLCERHGIRESAEAVGRGIAANFYKNTAPIPRIARTKLPMPEGTHPAWEQVIGLGWQWRGLDLPEAKSA